MTKYVSIDKKKITLKQSLAYFSIALIISTTIALGVFLNTGKDTTTESKASSVTAQSQQHVIEGTFIQLWNNNNSGGTWDQKRWDQEILRMKESCQDTIFIQFATHGDTAWYHESELAFVKHTNNAMQYIFHSAEKYNINVIVGLSHGSGQWDWNNDMNKADYSLIKSRHQGVIDELTKLFGTSSAFAGWYIPQELDWIRFPYNSQAQLSAARLFEDTAIYAKSKINKPVYIAPYFQDMNSKDTEIWWDKFLSIANHLDVILPQDGGGRQNANIEKFVATYAAIKKSALKHNITFGVDIETFAPGAKPAEWNRVLTQLNKANAQDPSIIVQFEYSYMNPSLGDQRAQLYDEYTTWQKRIHDCTWDSNNPSIQSSFVDVQPSH